MATIFIIHKSSPHMAIVVTSYEYTDFSYSQLMWLYSQPPTIGSSAHSAIPAQHYVSSYEYLKLLT